MLTSFTRNNFELAPVVQRADNSIQRITHYPVDKMYQFRRYILSVGYQLIRWIELSAL